MKMYAIELPNGELWSFYAEQSDTLSALPIWLKNHPKAIAVAVDITVTERFQSPKAESRAALVRAATQRLDSLDDATLAALKNGDLISTEPKGGA